MNLNFRNRTIRTEIWDCDLLVMVDGDGDVAFAGRAKVEFTPKEMGSQLGHLVAPGVNIDGWVPAMEVDSRMLEVTHLAGQPQFPHRGGRTLFGHDEEGNEFTWLINVDAERYLAGEVIPQDASEV